MPLHAPFKQDHTLIIKLQDCMIELSKKQHKLHIAPTNSCENKLVIIFKDIQSFEYLFSSKNMSDYSNRLVKIATEGKVMMDPGPYRNPMLSGFHRFIGYCQKKKGLQTFCWMIPIF
ncbi:MAG: hypothetical protein ACTSRS_09160 [Candidatus Helarchaeota archaeon]